MYKIYKLMLDGVPIYIGKTKQKYYSNRKAKGYHSNPKVQEVIKLCSYETIEETTDPTRERFWIDEYIRLGYKLYNIRGGDGITEQEHKIQIKNWMTNNKEYMKQYKKEYYSKNKEKNKKKHTEYMREYRKNKKINYES